MYLHLSDPRLPLKTGDVIEAGTTGRIVVDKCIGSGGFSLMYLAHREGSDRYLALKELFPRQLENVIVHRSPDGRIGIFDPVSGMEAPDNDALWQELTGYFEREARLTRLAGTVYDRQGNQTGQNHPDVLHVDGPFRDRRGNYYLAIDTYQGESLRDFIERGFVRSENGDVIANEFLEDILGILTETAIRLSALHAQGLWHLDLSPDNIYVVPSAGQTRLVPYIIDYGSAYDRRNPEEKYSHRYTCNPFSPPEVLALAQLQDQSCGYAPDASSDTYGLASILFYAVTGQVFSPEHRMHRTDWARKLRREFAAGLPSHQGADPFVNALVDFWDKGLRVAQRNRYSTATALHNALKQLSSRYREYGNMLPEVEPDELMSYMVLEKYPLYQYKGSDGNIHVLCLGSGTFVKRMILSLISCGQMIGSHLYIHVISNEREDLLKNDLLSAAPLLKDYSNLAGGSKEEYVTFSYEHVNDVLDPQTCRSILERYADTYYFLISLGSNSSNLQAVRLYAQTLAERPNPGGQQTILNYYCSEDAANNLHGVADWANLPEWLKADAFGINLSSYSKTIRTLGLRTIKLAHMYNKLENPNISLEESAQKLAAKAYDQRSSCAAALHLKYKLASIGINPAPSTNKRAIISAYQKFLQGNNIGALMELEHRRWMMYMIADKYRRPSMDELNQYGFEMVDGEFNDAWKCKKEKLHPCLVPCSSAGAVLKPRDFQKYASPAEIRTAPFDELDIVSLTLHAMSGEKCRSILRRNIIEAYFISIANRLNDAQSWTWTSQEEPQPSAILYDGARKLLGKVQDSICTAARTLQYKTDHGMLAELEYTFNQCGINISGEIEGLRRALAVFKEYASLKDYKHPDVAIIQNLLWILYAENEITVIKLSGRTISDNITGPLILDPHRLIFFGEQPHPEWDSFLHRHGNHGKITYQPQCGSTLPEICAALKQTADQQQGKCVIDITGASERMVIAAQRIADGNHNVSLIRSTPDGSLENIHRFVTAPAYTLNTAIAANEIFSLHGAAEKPSANRYMEQLEDMVPLLWQLYQEFRKDWNMVTAFFANRASGSAEFWMRDILLTPDTDWLPYTQWIDRAKWSMLELENVFDKLTGTGIIREFNSMTDTFGNVTLSFRYPRTRKETGDDSFRRKLDDFFGDRLHNVFGPLLCDVKLNPESGYTVDIRSGCWVDIRDHRSRDFPDRRQNSDGGTKRYTYSAIVPALKRLEELHLIRKLDTSVPSNGGPVRISFFYTIPAVKDCLTIAGNILELHIWKEARKTHYFDHAQANFSFTWKEGVSNELDVILTKGLTSLIVSAKTSRFNKEHLYEIKYLTERFSLNSKPVIVYSSSQAYEDGHLSDNLLPVKNRAKAMGVWLIDLNELREQDVSLGDRLVAIADGTAPL